MATAVTACGAYGRFTEQRTGDSMARSMSFHSLLCLYLLAAGAVSLGMARPADAAKLHFGTSEYLEKIQDTQVTGQNNEKLYLGYKYSHYAFIAPYRMTDDGYILGIEGQNRYYTLTPELRDRLQAQGLLPKPLPPYEIGWIHWVFGHLAWIVLGIIALSWLASARRSKKAAAAVPLVQEGLAHHQAGRLDEAIGSYDKAIAVRPLPDALFLRADAHLAKGEPLKAVADYSMIIKAQSKNADALFRRAGVLAGLQRHDEALADLNRVAKIEKKNPDVLLARGEVQAAKGADQRALADFDAALAANAERADILSARASVYERLGDSAKAAADRAAASRISERQ